MHRTQPSRSFPPRLIRSFRPAIPDNNIPVPARLAGTGSVILHKNRGRSLCRLSMDCCENYLIKSLKPRTESRCAAYQSEKLWQCSSSSHRCTGAVLPPVNGHLRFIPAWCEPVGPSVRSSLSSMPEAKAFFGIPPPAEPVVSEIKKSSRSELIHRTALFFYIE